MSALRDPYRLRGSGYLLDQIPTLAMGQALQRMDDGDHIVLARVSRGYASERTGEPVAGGLVKALLSRHGSASPISRCRSSPTAPTRSSPSAAWPPSIASTLAEENHDP